MYFKLIELGKTEVIGIPVLLAKSQSENFDIISNHWKNFNQQLKKNNRANKKNWRKYGITYKIENKYYYTSSIEPEYLFENTDFEKYIIVKGTYAKFRHRGAMKRLKDTYYKIYKNILPNCDLVPKKNCSLLHFERYDHRFNWNHSDSIIDIFILIEKKK